MNKKTRNIVLISVGVVVILVSFFVYKKVKEPKDMSADQSSSESVVQDTQKSAPENTNTVEIKNTATDSDVKKFNIAIGNAQKASLASQYELAIKYYNEALIYKKNDSAPYAGLYTVYLNQKRWNDALDAINKGIQISPLFGDYWNWKILVMDQGLNKTFSELKKVYDEGYPKVRTNEKVNLVTKFAVVAENKGEKAEAIKLWQKAIELVPENKAIYQSEIDRLNR